MKLDFLTHRYNATLGANEYCCITNKEESKKYETRGFVPLSDSALQFAKALKHNEEFKDFVKLSELSGVPIWRYKKNTILKVGFDSFIYYEGLHDFEYMYKKLEAAKFGLKDIQKNFNIHPYLVPQIPYILQNRCLSLKYLRPSIEVMPFTTIKKGSMEWSDEELEKHLDIDEDNPEKDFLMSNARANITSLNLYYEDYAKFTSLPPVLQTHKTYKELEKAYMELYELIRLKNFWIKRNMPEIFLSDAVFIKVSTSDVSRKAIGNTLKSNEIKKKLKALEYYNFKISTRDYRIFNTRKKTATEMAEKLYNTRKNAEGEPEKMTEWTVRMARKRVRDKIRSLFSIKPHHKDEFYKNLKNLTRKNIT